MKNIELPNLKTLTVTDTDIKKGKRENAEYCPIAYALRREFKNFDIVDVSVDGATPTITVALPSAPVRLGKQVIRSKRADQVIVYLTLPYEAQEFIETFDKKGRDGVRPTAFKVKSLDAELNNPQA